MHEEPSNMHLNELLVTLYKIINNLGNYRALVDQVLRVIRQAFKSRLIYELLFKFDLQHLQGF